MNFISADARPQLNWHVALRLSQARACSTSDGGLGGSARYLAEEHQCQVTGIDLTQEYVDVANALKSMVGLSDKVTFRQPSALEMPFDADRGRSGLKTA